jgi:hypothetical protein
MAGVMRFSMRRVKMVITPASLSSEAAGPYTVL